MLGVTLLSSHNFGPNRSRRLLCECLTIFCEHGLNIFYEARYDHSSKTDHNIPTKQLRFPVPSELFIVIFFWLHPLEAGARDPDAHYHSKSFHLISLPNQDGRQTIANSQKKAKPE